MIELFRTEQSKTADWVEAEFRELVVGYRKILTTPQHAAELFGEQVALPVIRENGRLISGRDNLLDYLRDLEKLATEWRRFQSDACYIDEDGEVC